MINQNRLILLSFGKRGHLGEESIILGDNPAGHCFVLRDLIPMKFFKYVIIVKLKMHTTVKIFAKICVQKLLEIPFCDQERAPM